MVEHREVRNLPRVARLVSSGAWDLDPWNLSSGQEKNWSQHNLTLILVLPIALTNLNSALKNLVLPSIKWVTPTNPWDQSKY